MDRSSSRDLQHVALPTAASLVYFGITGMTLDATNASRMAQTLNDIAHAISIFVPVHMRINGNSVSIDPAVLKGARFIAGAHRLVTKDGNELSGLSLQRRDIAYAVGILKAANIRL